MPKNLYFAPIKIPKHNNNIKVNTLEPKSFAQGVLDSIDKLNDDRKDVLVYIHGYQVLSSLKLDLFSCFCHNYMRAEGNKLAKVNCKWQ